MASAPRCVRGNDVRASRSTGGGRDSTSVEPRVSTMYIVSARAHVRRRELGVPLRAAIVDARGAVGVPALRRAPTGRRRATAAAPARRAPRASGARRSYRDHREHAADEQLHRHATRRATRRCRRRERDADRQQVERAGHELGADQQRRQRSTRSSNRVIQSPPRTSRCTRSIRHFDPPWRAPMLRDADAGASRDRASAAVFEV